MRFKQAIDLDRNRYALTNNGAVTLQSSTDPLVDLFFLIGASRGKNITAVFDAAYQVDPTLTTKIALWARDCRGGAGERELFRQYLRWLETKNPLFVYDIIVSGKIQELGRWDDLLVFNVPQNQQLAYGQIANGLSDEKTVGLVAKWMPRQGPVAERLAQWFNVSARTWRKLLVNSTNVVEQKMCAKKWNEINFSHVPSVAASRYQKAFTKRAPEAYAAYKNALVKGEAKVNASTLYPYDVIKSLFFGDASVAKAQWDALPDYLGNNGNILVMPDVSGSMGSDVPGSSVTMMDVSISLAMYIALRQKGPMHRVVMNFSTNSELIHLKKTTLTDLYREVSGMKWGMSTNLSGAFENLVTFAKRNDLSNEDMPKMILIISDMEFDRCASMTNMEAIEKHYQVSGYDIPKIVFWNVNGRSGNVPVASNKEGVALISGFSPSIVKSVLSGKTFTPRDIMLETVDKPRYTI